MLLVLAVLRKQKPSSRLAPCRVYASCHCACATRAATSCSLLLSV